MEHGAHDDDYDDDDDGQVYRGIVAKNDERGRTIWESVRVARVSDRMGTVQSTAIKR